VWECGEGGERGEAGGGKGWQKREKVSRGIMEEEGGWGWGQKSEGRNVSKRR